MIKETRRTSVALVLDYVICILEMLSELVL